MAEVVFFTGVADTVDFAGRLLRKKYREGLPLAVYGPAPLLQRLDQALWLQEPLEFTPHVFRRAGTALPSASVVKRTLLWLLPEPDAALHIDACVNLGLDDFDLAAVHQRVAEVVSVDDASRAGGRARWKKYESQGHALTHHPQG